MRSLVLVSQTVFYLWPLEGGARSRFVMAVSWGKEGPGVHNKNVIATGSRLVIFRTHRRMRRQALQGEIFNPLLQYKSQARRFFCHFIFRRRAGHIRSLLKNTLAISICRNLFHINTKLCTELVLNKPKLQGLPTSVLPSAIYFLCLLKFGVGISNHFLFIVPRRRVPVSFCHGSLGKKNAAREDYYRGSYPPTCCPLY